jgi:hypothetical protein
VEDDLLGHVQARELIVRKADREHGVAAQMPLNSRNSRLGDGRCWGRALVSSASKGPNDKRNEQGRGKKELSHPLSIGAARGKNARTPTSMCNIVAPPPYDVDTLHLT